MLNPLAYSTKFASEPGEKVLSRDVQPGRIMTRVDIRKK
jgi:hypothetical protein